MGDLMSRRRYELLAVAIGVVCAGVHYWSDGQPASGLEAPGSPSPGVLLRTIQLIEGRANDMKFRARGVRASHPDVVVVAIDERSTQRFGLWPWSRSHIAEAIRALHAAGAKAIALDIAFTDEANESSSTAYKEMLRAFDSAVEGSTPEAAAQFASFRGALAQQSKAAPDLELAQAFTAAPEVVQGVIAYGEKDAKDISPDKVREHGALLEPQLLRKLTGQVPGSFHEVAFEDVASWRQFSAQTPLPLFAANGNRFGHFNMVPDMDGTIRRTPPLVALSGPKGLLPSLAVQAAAAYYDARAEIAFEHGQIEGVRLRRSGGKPPVLVPFTNDEPFLLVNHVGPWTAFKTLSVVDVIDGAFDKKQIEGKVVLVGVTVVGNSGDQRVTPFSELEPGIYGHASV
ncbi:MAG: CHASE2 domain-containing protein, partial [Myxococcaceae bacterium]